MATIFTKIINGEIPSYKIAENDQFIAFLDVNPLKKGHTLVVPKQEVDYYFDLDDSLLSQSMVFAKQVAKAMKEVLPCNRIGISVIGLEVPHAHIHLIPIHSISDMDFTQPRPSFTDEEMAETAKAFREQIEVQKEDSSLEIDYQDYLALALIYVANTSEGLSKEETNYIFSQVGQSHYDKALSYFKSHSEFEVINTIQELSKQFSKEREEVLQDMKQLIQADTIDQQLEQTIFTRLSRLI